VPTDVPVNDRANGSVVAGGEGGRIEPLSVTHAGQGILWAW
jgi:hypothetical protein